jgi:hypothetical protein
MLMAARQFDHLRHLGFRDFESVNAADSNSVAVNVQHNLDRFLVGFPEETLQYMHDELHRRVIIVKDEDPVQRGFLGFWPGLGDNAGPGA